MPYGPIDPKYAHATDLTQPYQADLVALSKCNADHKAWQQLAEFDTPLKAQSTRTALVRRYKDFGYSFKTVSARDTNDAALLVRFDPADIKPVAKPEEPTNDDDQAVD